MSLLQFESLNSNISNCLPADFKISYFTLTPVSMHQNKLLLLFFLFVANSSSCTTTELSKLLTSCRTTIQNHVIKNCEKLSERSGKNLFLSTKNSCLLNKLISRGFPASSLSIYDFSTLCVTLPHNLFKDKLVDLIERTFQREGSLYIAFSDRNAFFTSDAVRNYNLWSWQKVCEALTFILDNIHIRSGTKLYRQIVGIPMGTNCAPLVTYLFLSVMRGYLI